MFTIENFTSLLIERYLKLDTHRCSSSFIKDTSG